MLASVFHCDRNGIKSKDCKMFEYVILHCPQCHSPSSASVKEFGMHNLNSGRPMWCGPCVLYAYGARKGVLVFQTSPGTHCITEKSRSADVLDIGRCIYLLYVPAACIPSAWWSCAFLCRSGESTGNMSDSAVHLTGKFVSLTLAKQE